MGMVSVTIEMNGEQVVLIGIEETESMNVTSKMKKNNSVISILIEDADMDEMIYSRHYRPHASREPVNPSFI